MADNVLAALAGLAGGLGVGLEKGREQKNIEAERAFRFQQYDSEMRRNAVLDKLNEQVTKSRIVLANKAYELQKDAADREKANATEIPYDLGEGEVINVPKSAAQVLDQYRAQLKMQQQQQVEVPTGGFVDPAVKFNRESQNAEAAARRTEVIKREITDLYKSLRASGLDPASSETQALDFARKLYPEELEGLNPEDWMPQTEEEVESGGGYFAGSLADRFNKKLVGILGQSRVRYIPEELRGMQAQRQQQQLERQAASNRALMSIPSPSPELADPPSVFMGTGPGSF